jgi:predicted nucleic acid-binding protein
MKYTEDQIKAIIETMTTYHLMLQYLKEHVSEETWKRSKEYSNDFADSMDFEVSEDDDGDYENYAKN